VIDITAKGRSAMTRRGWFQALLGVGAVGAAARFVGAADTGEKAPTNTFAVAMTEADWQKRLTPAQFTVLRKHGTERAGSSPLDKEYRPGIYNCAGCELALFSSDTKFDSGTGWPSFFTTIPGVFETKTDRLLFFPRTEYHCKRCGGHHGHVFDDGPPPTGQRWCNNGVALKFIPKTGKA
jgi:peptide-methionine (R)-S-oxide reductase